MSLILTSESDVRKLIEKVENIDTGLKISHIEIKPRIAFYLSGLSLILVGFFLESTLLPQVLSAFLAFVTPLKVSGSALVLISLLLKRKYSSLYIFASAFFLVTAIIVKQNSSTNLLFVMLLIIGAESIDFDQICKIYLFLDLLLTILTIFLCFQGIIPNLTYNRDGILRQSLGFIYPTDFAAHLTYMYLAFCYLRRHHYRWFDATIGILLAFFQERVCNARLDMSLVLLSVLLFLLASKSLTSKNLRFWNVITSSFSKALFIALPLAYIFTFLLSKWYLSGNNIVDQINSFLSNRVSLVAEGMQRYPITMFGQVVESSGLGGLLGQSLDRNLYGYFMLDSSYAICVINFGLVMTGVSLFIFWKIIRNASRGNLHLLIIIAILIIHFFVAQFMLNPSYNVFLLACFSEVANDRGKLKKSEAELV
ncbi:hypothetical protein [Lacticaseibacillus paracasei]